MENENNQNQPKPETEHIHNLNASSVQSNPPTQPEKPKRKLPLAKLPVAGIVILITLAAFGLIAYLMMGQNKADEAQFEEITTEVPSPTPNPTANWNIYTNEKYEFSFKYPKDWTYGETESNEILYPLLNVYLRPINPSPADQTYGLIQINIYKSEYDTVQEYIDLGCKEECKNVEKIEIANVPAIKTSLPGVIPTDVVTFIKGENMYKVILGIDNSYKDSLSIEEKKDIFNQILSTFKFTDASGTSNVDALDPNSENTFDINNINAGDSIGNFKVTKIETANNNGSISGSNFRITFQGQISLTGKYTIFDIATPGVRENEVRFTPDENSAKLLPQEVHIMKYGYTKNFRFDNYDFAYNMLNKFGNSGTKKVIIDNYTMVGMIGEDTFTADLIQVN